MKIIFCKGMYDNEEMPTMLKHPHLLFKNGAAINLIIPAFMLLLVSLIPILIIYPHKDLMPLPALYYTYIVMAVWLGVIFTGIINRTRSKIYTKKNKR